MGQSRQRPSAGPACAHAWFPAQWQVGKAVRTWARETIGAFGSREATDDVVLLLSELVSNVLKYTDAETFLVEIQSNDRLVVAVCDPSGQLPVLTRAQPQDQGGRGLALLDALATSWGVWADAQGKCVWFEMATPHLT